MKYSKDLQIIDASDVLVLGGGVSGVAAAVAAARHNLSVTVVEATGSVGGSMTHSTVSTLMGESTPGGIAYEIAQLLYAPDAGTAIDPEFAKTALQQLLEDNHVKLYLETTVVDTIVDNHSIQVVAVQTKTGVKAMQAETYIDATGDGYVAFSAHCPYEYGRPEDGLVQPVSVMFHVIGVDPNTKVHCRHEEDDFMLPNGKKYLQQCEESEKNGELPPCVSIVRLYPSIEKGEYLINASQLGNVNTLEESDLTKASLILRHQVKTITDFLRTYVPGFSNVKAILSSDWVGVRESRRFLGQYVLKAEDIIDGSVFDDVVVHGAKFPIDIHNPKGGGQAERKGIPVQGQKYDIPMRCLQQNEIDNLILCGRNISGTHRAHASYRVMMIVMGIGQAAASMAVVRHITKQPIQKLDYKKVQAILEKDGCKLRG